MAYEYYEFHSEHLQMGSPHKLLQAPVLPQLHHWNAIFRLSACAHSQAANLEDAISHHASTIYLPCPVNTSKSTIQPVQGMRLGLSSTCTSSCLITHEIYVHRDGGCTPGHTLSRLHLSTLSGFVAWLPEFRLAHARCSQSSPLGSQSPGCAADPGCRHLAGTHSMAA